MKGLIWMPLVLVIGMAFGAWPAQREAARLKRETEELRQQLRQRQRPGGTLSQLTQFMRIPESPRAIATTNAAAAGAPAPAPAADTAAAPTNRPRRRLPFSELRPRPGDERPLRERLNEAIEAWRVRSDIARNNFLARAGLGPEEAAKFDVLVQAMNLRLRDHFEKFSATVQSGAPITPELGARMIRNLSDAVVLTYDEMDRQLPRWRQNADGLDLGDLIDPAVAEPLLSIEDTLRRADRGGRP
ncbi:MAG: hypothetical protein N2652_08395 [Kiritimatiellae bacterium]|nr:hypothetical protein [Kiritimatiellia bacterium]